MSISRLPPRTFSPLASSGSTIGRVRLATPPACQIQVSTTIPFSYSRSANAFPIAALFQRALAHRAELRIGLHQRRVRIDGRLQGTGRAPLDLGRETATQAITEIALVDGPARKLMRDGQRARLSRPAGAQRCARSRCSNDCLNQPASSPVHVESPSRPAA